MTPSVTARTKTTARSSAAKLASLWNEIKLHLEDRRRSLAAEIRNYPTPIPRCDAQFNHLYQQQARLARELDGIGELGGENPKREDCIELIERFIASAPYTDDAVERALRSRIKTQLSALANHP